MGALLLTWPAVLVDFVVMPMMFVAACRPGIPMATYLHLAAWTRLSNFGACQVGSLVLSLICRLWCGMVDVSGV